jgi:hypothetical protein
MCTLFSKEYAFPRSHFQTEWIPYLKLEPEILYGRYMATLIAPHNSAVDDAVASLGRYRCIHTYGHK